MHPTKFPVPFAAVTIALIELYAYPCYSKFHIPLVASSIAGNAAVITKDYPTPDKIRLMINDIIS